MPEALAINDRFLAGLANGLGSCYADDHILGHHTWSYLLACQHWVAERPAGAAGAPGRIHFKNAGLVIERRGSSGALSRAEQGRRFQVLRQRAARAVRHAVLGAGRRPASRAPPSRIWSANTTSHLGEDEIIIRGKLGWAKAKQMTHLQSRRPARPHVHDRPLLSGPHPQAPPAHPHHRTESPRRSISAARWRGGTEQLVVTRRTHRRRRGTRCAPSASAPRRLRSTW